MCRRAERSAVGLSLKESNVVPYLNRLSDFLWSAARWQEGESVSTSKFSKGIRETVLANSVEFLKVIIPLTEI